MNYLRIYENFVASRRLLEQSLVDSGDYKEVHHILPRSLGGNNDKDNLIALTPEDHYFAHLLLAKIYGGKLWAAVFLMTSGRWRKSLIVGRRSMYGYAKRQWSILNAGQEGRKGADNGNHNPTLFNWINLDNDKKIESTIHNMCATYGGARATWTSVVNGDRKTAFGWTVEGSDVRIRGHKNKIHKFVNRDGRIFTGTQKQFCLHTGTSVASASRVCRHGDVTISGWRLDGVIDRHHNTSRVDGQHSALNKGNIFVLVNSDGKEISGTRQQIAKFVDRKVSTVSAALHYLKKNPQGSCYGYKLKEII